MTMTPNDHLSRALAKFSYSGVISSFLLKIIVASLFAYYLKNTGSLFYLYRFRGW